MKKYKILLLLIIVTVLTIGAGCKQVEESTQADPSDEHGASSGADKVEETAVVDEAVVDEEEVEEEKKTEEKESAQADSRADKISAEMKAIMDEISYAYSGEMKDVTGQKAIRGIATTDKSSGQAQADYINDKYMLIAEFENLPTPQADDFYEGWVVRAEPFDFISTGRLTLENDKYINRFVSEENWLDHSLYVLTLEPGDDNDPAPATHIFEGELEE